MHSEQSAVLWAPACLHLYSYCLHLLTRTGDTSAKNKASQQEGGW